MTYIPPQSTSKAVEVKSETQATVRSIMTAKVLNNLHRFSLTRIGKVTFATGFTISAIWAVNWTPSFLSAFSFLFSSGGFFLPKTLGVVTAVLLYSNRRKIRNIILRRIDHFTPKIDGIPRTRIFEHLWKFRTFSRDDFQKSIGGHKDKYEPLQLAFKSNNIIFKNKSANNRWELFNNVSKEKLERFLDSSDHSGGLAHPVEVYTRGMAYNKYMKSVGFTARRI